MIGATQWQAAHPPLTNSTPQAQKATEADQARPIVTKENREQSLPANEETKEKVKKAVDQLNHFLSGSSTHLKFQFHDQLKEYYVTIIDDKTDQVIKEIPPKRILDTYADMLHHVGILADEKV